MVKYNSGRHKPNTHDNELMFWTRKFLETIKQSLVLYSGNIELNVKKLLVT